MLTIEINQWSCLFAVDIESVTYHRLIVVTAALLHCSLLEALDDHFHICNELDNRIEGGVVLRKHVIQGVYLSGRARKAVEEKP